MRDAQKGKLLRSRERSDAHEVAETDGHDVDVIEDVRASF